MLSILPSLRAPPHTNLKGYKRSRCTSDTLHSCTLLSFACGLVLSIECPVLPSFPSLALLSSIFFVASLHYYHYPSPRSQDDVPHCCLLLRFPLPPCRTADLRWSVTALMLCDVFAHAFCHSSRAPHCRTPARQPAVQPRPLGHRCRPWAAGSHPERSCRQQVRHSRDLPHSDALNHVHSLATLPLLPASRTFKPRSTARRAPSA